MPGEDWLGQMMLEREIERRNQLRFAQQQFDRDALLESIYGPEKLTGDIDRRSAEERLNDAFNAHREIPSATYPLYDLDYQEGLSDLLQRGPGVGREPIRLQEGGIAGENYDWLTRGLEPPVRPEYLAQKRRNEELAAQAAAAYGGQGNDALQMTQAQIEARQAAFDAARARALEGRQVLGDDKTLESERQLARQDVHQTITMNIEGQNWEVPVFEDQVQGLGDDPSQWPQEVLDSIEENARDSLEKGLDPLTNEERTDLPPDETAFDPQASGGAASATQRQLLDKIMGATYGDQISSVGLQPDFSAENEPVYAQSGGAVPRFGGQNMNGISMGPPRRRTPTAANLMAPAIGMAPPRNTIPMPLYNRSGITMGDWGPPGGMQNRGPSGWGLPGGGSGGGPGGWGSPGGGTGGAPNWGAPGGLTGGGPGWGAPRPGSTDTVPAMLTPGEGVLNTGAMQMVGEPAVNALNQAGKGISMQGYAEGGTVEDDGKYQNPYPTFEETQGWTVEDWERWRRRHPRFEPSATPTPAPEYLGGGTGRVGGRGGGGHDFSGYDFDNPLNATPHGTGGLPNIGFYGGTMSNPTHWMDPNSEKGGPMPGGMRFGPFGAFNPMNASATSQALYGGPSSAFAKRWLDKMYPGRGYSQSANLEEGGIVPGYAFGGLVGGVPGSGAPTRNVIGTSIGTISNAFVPGLGFITSPIARWLVGKIQSGAFTSSAFPLQHNTTPPTDTPPGGAPAAAPPELGGGGNYPGWGLTSPIAGAGGPSQTELGLYGGGPSGMGPAFAGYRRPFLDKVFPGRGNPGSASLQEGGVVEPHPIGYNPPLEEQEWQKIIAMLPPKVDVAALRKQAESSGISPQALAGIAQMFMGGMGGGSDAAAVSSLGAAFGGGV